MSDAPRSILLFPSIHHVLAAERVLQEARIWYDLVPAPRELSSNCGVAIEVRQADLPRVGESAGRLGAFRAFRRAVEGYEEMPA